MKKYPEDFNLIKRIEYREHRLDKPYFNMKRKDWEKLKIFESKVVLIKNLGDIFPNPENVFPFPINIYRELSIEKSNNCFVMKLFRHDPNDPPNEQVNMDEYEIHENVPLDYDIEELVISSSTCLDTQLETLLASYVSVIKRNPRFILDHHLPNFPSKK